MAGVAAGRPATRRASTPRRATRSTRECLIFRRPESVPAVCGVNESMNPDVAAGRGELTALASLRRFVRPRTSTERCELCDAGLAADHAHLVEVATRRLACACDACAILFDGQGETRYRRVPRRVRYLADFRLTDEVWEGLSIPINLAFFVRSTPAKRTIALYPSPAGATESLISLETWDALMADNPVLRDFEPDAEALLVNRMATARDYYRVGIDECYKLAGLIRIHWRGLSGGQAVWDEIHRFFAALKEGCS